MKKIKFDSDQCLVTLITDTKKKSNNNKIAKSVHGKAPKERLKYIGLSAIVTDSVFSE